MHGQGKFSYPDGRMYEGQFTADKKNGQGLMVWPDGRKYQGGWKNGRQHGDGQIISADGSIQKGKWLDGKPICWYDENGQRIMTSSARETVEESFKVVQSQKADGQDLPTTDALLQ